MPKVTLRHATLYAVVLSVFLCQHRLLRRGLWHAWRWVRALLWQPGFRAMLWHYRLEKETRCSRHTSCVSCGSLLLPCETYRSCAVCTGFNLCEVCIALGARPPIAKYASLMQHHKQQRHKLVLMRVCLNVDASTVSSAPTTRDALDTALKLFAQRPCIGTREPDGDYRWLKYSQVREQCRRVGSTLASMVSSGEQNRPRFVAILGGMSLPWLLTNIGCLLMGVPIVPLHRATTATQLKHILQVADVVVIVASVHRRSVVRSTSPSAHGVKHVVWVDDAAENYPPDSQHDARSALDGVEEHAWATLCSQHPPPPIPHRRVDPDTVVQLLPSSGSTGSRPKLIIVTECMRQQAVKALPTASPIVVVLAYEIMRQPHAVLLQGGRIGLFGGSFGSLLSDCQALRPTMFAATPAVYNRIFSDFKHELQRSGLDSDKQQQLMHEWRERAIFGNRIQALVTTGAPLAHRVSRWLCRVVGCTVLDGFGTTETGGLTSNGKLVPGVELRLLDCPEMGYTTADKPYPRGEILAHSKKMSPGYYNPPGDWGDDNDRNWVNLGGLRYFRTGDVGELVKGNIRVIDRCKSVFKLAQGIFVPPEPLEARILRSPFVKQVFVWGNSTMSAVSAVVVPTQALLEHVVGNDIAKANGDEGDATDVCVDKLLQQCCVDPGSGGVGRHHARASATVRADIIKHLVASTSDASYSSARDAKHVRNQAHDRVNGQVVQEDDVTDEGVRAWEVPQHVVLCREPFTQWNGLLTSVGKHRRPALIRKFRHLLCTEHSVLPMTKADADTAGMDGRGVLPLGSGLREILCEVTGVQHTAVLTPQTPIMALGLGSISVCQLSSRLRQRFGITLSPRVIFGLPTLADLESAVFGTQRVTQKCLIRARVIRWPDELAQALDALEKDTRQIIAKLEKVPRSNTTEQQTPLILLTGSTGFMGAFLLDALVRELQHTPAQTGVVCLVRGPGGASRLKSSLKSYCLWSKPLSEALEGGTMEVWEGDICSAMLGLDVSNYDRLCGRLVGIVHAAAQVSGTLPYARLRDSNVGGTRRVLQLALATARRHAQRRVHVSHISTLGFVPPKFEETSETQSLARLASSMHTKSGYAQSKWLAERLVLEVVERHRDDLGSVSLYRPGQLSGHSRTGASNKRDAASLLLVGLVRLRAECTASILSPLPRKFNLCPVDFAANAVVLLSLRAHWRDWRGPGASETPIGSVRAHHLCAPDTTKLSTLCEWARAGGVELAKIGAGVWCQRVQEEVRDPAHPLFPLRPILSNPLSAPVPDSRGECPTSAMTTRMIERLRTQEIGSMHPLPSRMLTQNTFLAMLKFLMEDDDLMGRKHGR